MKSFKVFLFFTMILPLSVYGQLGIWTSAEELAEKPMSGLPWDELLSAADGVNPNYATVSDQNSNNNVGILAAAIVYARTGEVSYKDKVIAACDKLVSEGHPADRTLAWARETGAYALAADLVEYRPNELKVWLRAMAEAYVADDDRTMIYMFHLRPNNWGTMGFGSLCAIYAFLNDTTSLKQVRNYWIQSVTGPKPELLTYGSDISWHIDPENLRLINPKGSVKSGLNIDGIIPDDMRRGTSFRNPPVHTGYAWETLQGLVTGARILDRFGMPIWTVSDSALKRAIHVIQVDWENKFDGWKAEGDDLWMLPFIDDVYGTDYSDSHHEFTWGHGKISGWPYVIWDGIQTQISEMNSAIIPKYMTLNQNYPNPFNPSTVISYTLTMREHVKLNIFDITGKKVASLVDEIQDAGKKEYIWYATLDSGNSLPSGIYFCTLKVGPRTETNKMLYLR